MSLLILAAASQGVYIAILLLRNLKAQVVAFIPLALAAAVLYLIAVWLVFRRGQAGGQLSQRRTLAFVFAAGLVFRATLFPLYPSLSDDLFRYRWDGKMQVAGYNPYLLAPADPSLKHLRDQTYQAVNGKNYVAVYGPLSESLFRWWYPVAAAPSSIYLSVLLSLIHI